jgi:hypothetical protein
LPYYISVSFGGFLNQLWESEKEVCFGGLLWEPDSGVMPVILQIRACEGYVDHTQRSPRDTFKAVPGLTRCGNSSGRTRL